MAELGGAVVRAGVLHTEARLSDRLMLNKDH